MWMKSFCKGKQAWVIKCNGVSITDIRLRNWTSVPQDRLLKSSWVLRLQMARENSHFPPQEEGGISGRDPEKAGSGRGETQGKWSFRNQLHGDCAFCSSFVYLLILEPWGRGPEALSWETRAWEGSPSESNGGEQQLQQDGRGET